MEEATHRSVSAEISRRAVQILADYTGRGPTKAHTLVNRDLITILLGDTLTKGERRLAEMKQQAHVLETRRRYQSAMQDDLVAAVEEESGRKVIAFMSDNHIEPDVAAEIFVLEREDNGSGPLSDASTHGPPSGV